MQKLIILLLVAAVLMSTQAVLQEKRPKEKIKLLSKRKTDAEKQQKRSCSDDWQYCESPTDCCSWDCDVVCSG
nr:TPA_inf: conotoxin precursor O2 [Conus ebraeus]DAZ86506.1 TPA_inf: conotoxin precursor O2 [Conus judaeus]